MPLSPLVLLFCIFHHAHVLEKHACQSMLSRVALAFGVVAAFGAFAAGNCNVSPTLVPKCHGGADQRRPAIVII